MDPVSLKEAYQAAHEQVIVVDHSDEGLLSFSGQTRLDLINRMSTQKVDGLSAMEGAATILTTDVGRIIDRLILYADQDEVLCLTGRNNGDNIARYLMRFVFFMDDFQVKDLGPNKAILAIYGAGAQALAARIAVEAEAMELHHWCKTQLDDLPISLHRTDPVSGGGYLLICPVEEKMKLHHRLVALGAVPADQAAFDYLRIESGLPLFGSELTPDYIPLEAGLRQDVSFNKGCYTGQEIIARMDSRDQLAKSLVNLIPDAPVEPGAGIMAGEKQAGNVTSAAAGPAGPLAMGYVKSRYLDEGTPLFADGVPLALQQVIGQA